MKPSARIQGIDYPKQDPATNPALAKVPFVRLRNFVWLALLASIAGCTSGFGTLHVRYIYTYTGKASEPYYHRCDYAGWYSQRILPRNGQCPLFRLLKAPINMRARP